MRVRFNIDFEISPRVKRALKIGIPSAILLTGSIVYASVPTTFKDGDTLSAQSMNDNFSSLDARLAKIEALAAKQSADGGFSIGGTYCGATGSTTAGLAALTGLQTSYAKARTACQTACSQPSAHMCTGEELTRTAQLGLTATAGWYTSGAHDETSSECTGWTDNASNSFQAPYWSNLPNSDYCNVTHPVLCCN